MVIRVIPAVACAAGALLLAACGGHGTSPTSAVPAQVQPSGSQGTAATPAQQAPARSLPTACAVATTAEVATLAGGNVTRVTPPNVPTLSGTSNCVYSTATGGNIAILLDTRPGVGAAVIQGAESQGGKAVSGVGDSAALSVHGNIVAVNAVKGGLMISVSAANTSATPAAMESFVQMLFGRA